jgi:hypothetical protein
MIPCPTNKQGQYTYAMANAKPASQLTTISTETVRNGICARSYPCCRWTGAGRWAEHQRRRAAAVMPRRGCEQASVPRLCCLRNHRRTSSVMGSRLASARPQMRAVWSLLPEARSWPSGLRPHQRPHQHGYARKIGGYMSGIGQLRPCPGGGGAGTGEQGLVRDRQPLTSKAYGCPEIRVQFCSRCRWPGAGRRGRRPLVTLSACPCVKGGRGHKRRRAVVVAMPGRGVHRRACPAAASYI